MIVFACRETHARSKTYSENFRQSGKCAMLVHIYQHSETHGYQPNEAIFAFYKLGYLILATP